MDNQQATHKQPYNRIVRVGIWMTVVPAAIWGGNHLVSYVAGYLPYAVAVGIAVLAIGLVFQYRKPKSTPDSNPSQNV